MKAVVGDKTVELTPDEIHLAQLFRKMDDRSQRTTMSDVECMAAKHPRSIVPALRLIVGGAT